MKKILLLTSMLILAFTTIVNAQEKFKITPSLGVAHFDSKTYFDFTLSGEYRAAKWLGVDLTGAYAFTPKGERLASAAVMFTPYFGTQSTTGFYVDFSAGAGLQKTHKSKDVEFIVPVRANAGYKFSDQISAGLTGMCNISFNSHTSIHYGAFIAYRF